MIPRDNIRSVKLELGTTRVAGAMARGVRPLSTDGGSPSDGKHQLESRGREVQMTFDGGSQCRYRGSLHRTLFVGTGGI